CNNPADAWPIITANKISIYAMSEADKRGGWGAEAFHPNDAYSFNDNPLRAAMIVFLMMQESANVPANSTGSDLR
ncbi:phage protein NinX family protein, partial [Enterobacter hormaechei]